MKLLLTKPFVEKIDTLYLNLKTAINLNVAMEDSVKDADFYRSVPKDVVKDLLKVSNKLQKISKKLKRQSKFK